MHGGWEGGMRTGVGTYWVKEKNTLRKQYAGQWLNNLQHVSRPSLLAALSR